MDPFVPSRIKSLRWLRTAEAPPSFDMRDGDSIVAQLAFRHHGGSRADVSTASESWSLKRVGFVHPQVSIRRTGSPPSEDAHLTVHWRRSLLERPGAPPEFLVRAGVAIPAWEGRTPEGTLLYHVEPVAEDRKLVGGLAILTDSGRAAPRLLESLTVAWYYLVLGWFEEELAAATASALVAIS